MSDSLDAVPADADAVRLSKISRYPFEFSPNNTEYSHPNALACALACSLSYVSNKKKVREVASRWGCEPEFLGEGDPDWGLSLVGKDYVLTAFRGTDHKSDWWKSNLRIFPTLSPWGWVHRGFWGAHDRLWPDLKKVLDIDNRQKLVWLTGHSLGGAIAQLTVMRVANDLARGPAAVYTFSQPRAAGWKFRDSVLSQGVPYYRFVSSIDPIPSIPFNPWSTVGCEYYVDAKGKIFEHGSAGFMDKGKDHLSVDGSVGNRHGSGPEELSKSIGTAAHPIDRYFEPLHRKHREIG